MSKEFQVNCIRKPNRLSTHEHITNIGNNQQNWLLTRESATNRIEAGEEAFYTLDSTTAKKAYVGIVKEPGKLPYLRTHADGKWNNNLLAQPECGTNCKLVA